MAVPSRILAIANGMATVESLGLTRQTSLMMLDGEAAVGDWVILGAGGNFAAEVIPEELALAALDYLTEVLANGQA
jgi:hydrogenase expression/formation protein HypC